MSEAAEGARSADSHLVFVGQNTTISYLARLVDQAGLKTFSFDVPIVIGRKQKKMWRAYVTLTEQEIARPASNASAASSAARDSTT